VGTEAANHLPARTDNSHVAIVAAQEEVAGTRADTGYFVALEYGSCFVIGKLDLVDIEEVERLPLLAQDVSAGLVAIDVTAPHLQRAP